MAAWSFALSCLFLRAMLHRIVTLPVPADSRSGSSTEIGQQVAEKGAVAEKSLGVDVLPGL